MDQLPTIDEGSVVVGVDDSEHGRRALAWAVEEAAVRGVPVVAINAWQYPLKGVHGAPDDEPVDADKIERARLQTVIDSTLGDGASAVRAEAVFGFPGKVLASLSEHAGLVVVGPRGKSGLAKFTLGSTADHVVKHATCPVVIVH